MNTYKTNATKDFLGHKETIYAGFSKKNEAYSMAILDLLTEAGLTVYPYNPVTQAEFGVQVYRSLAELPKRPETAFVAMTAAHSLKAVEELGAFGIRRILFVNSRAADKKVMDACERFGIQVAIACPFMLYGSGFHRFHGWLAGVRP